MQEIWDDDGLSASFVDAFEAWATTNGGDVEEHTAETLFCEFPPTDDQIRMRVGLYEAGGRHRLRFETVREELEVKLLSKYETTDSKLLLQSDKASRTFLLDAQAGEWRVEKRPVADVA
ncbi:hypothetical protein [Halobacterium yunchengense]|uniref:hypothetical protein n=1 Tax=Halobacterium yunchengense TaxID=3108497 RepID=UPI00300949F3